ncbi:MAG: acyl-CoA/acyl-ACP dehydrogenase [Deltaproteobacteria bacterium]|nr:acyl-CoA/acyl-ACP dehydrogenase [Deltaproteobacteria bacterium]
MDYSLSEEQNILKKSAHDFLAKECPKDLVRKLEESYKGYSTELWQKMAELGWMGLTIPEEYGGSGGSFLDLIILFEEIGYNIVPGPFLSTVLFGCMPIVAAGSETQKKKLLPGIASGELIITMALTEPEASYRASSIKVRANVVENEYVINGTKLFVPDANNADYLLCVARTGKEEYPEKGLTIFIVDAGDPGIKLTPLKTLSGDKQSEVEFRNVRVKKTDILGGLDSGWPIAQDTLQKASIALCAQMIGGAQAVMDMSLEYAKQRTQFNHPIGSFQAIQHHFANMWADINGSKYLLYRAAWKISVGLPAGIEVAMAKSRVGAAYRRVTILGHQIFGGIGFTREHDLHLYHKRSITSDSTWGNSYYQNQIVADELGL